MVGLTDLERAVVEKLLAGEHPVLAALREQASGLELQRREVTGAGFFCDLQAPAPSADLIGATLMLADVEAEIDGVARGASFVLVIKKGRMTLLEGFTQDEPWPATVGAFTLRYATTPRDLAMLD